MYGFSGGGWCNKWSGWIPASVVTPDTDEYVLVQLTEEYAGEEKITTGIYFKEQVKDTGMHKKGEWLIGHISVLSVEDNEVCAWRPLPKPIEEKRLIPDIDSYCVSGPSEEMITKLKEIKEISESTRRNMPNDKC